MPKHLREDGFIEYTGLWWKFALPQVILLVHGTIAGLCAWWSAERYGALDGRVLLWFAIGLAAWTLFEYILHRWLLHHTKYRPLRWLFWKVLHAEHHGYQSMKDPDHHGVHTFVSVQIMGVGALAVWLATSTGWAPAFLSGWVVGYCGYEGLHWVFHSGTPGKGMGRIPYVQHLWDAHTVHHLQKIDKNYGFITAFWDRVFGTFVPVDEPASDAA